jgi:hypothetical protein
MLSKNAFIDSIDPSRSKARMQAIGEHGRSSYRESRARARGPTAVRPGFDRESSVQGDCLIDAPVESKLLEAGYWSGAGPFGI